MRRNRTGGMPETETEEGGRGMNRYITARRIEASLDSLRESTDLTIRSEEIGVALKGRNSPYASHKELVVTSGHYQRPIIISNSRAIIAVAPTIGALFRGTFAVLECPASIIRGILRPGEGFPFRWPEWVDGLVSVAIADTFKGYAEDGKPIFGPAKWGWGDYTIEDATE